MSTDIVHIVYEATKDHLASHVGRFVAEDDMFIKLESVTKKELEALDEDTREYVIQHSYALTYFPMKVGKNSIKTISTLSNFNQGLKTYVDAEEKRLATKAELQASVSGS